MPKENKKSMGIGIPEPYNSAPQEQKVFLECFVVYKRTNRYAKKT